MKVVFLKVYPTVKENRPAKMETHIKDNLCMVKNLGMESIIFQMEKCIQVSSTIIKVMVMAK
jgi:hypothetical protein